MTKTHHIRHSMREQTFMLPLRLMRVHANGASKIEKIFETNARASLV